MLKSQEDGETLGETNDVVVFMAAYGVHNLKKTFPSFHKNNKGKHLFKKYHIKGMANAGLYVSSDGKVPYTAEYDIVTQKSKCEIDINSIQLLKSNTELLNDVARFLSIYHSYQSLLDNQRVNFSFFFDLESFLVVFGEKTYQVDPIAYCLNQTLIINYKLIDFDSSEPLTSTAIYGRHNNLNIQRIDKFKYFDGNNFINTDKKISDIIYENLCDFFDELLSGKYKIGNHTFMHNILVCSNNISDEEKYIQKILNIDIPGFKVKNIAPNNNFKYFVTGGIGVVTNVNSNIDSILYDLLILESFKIYLMLNMIMDYDIHNNLNELIDNQITTKSMFYPFYTPIPIITLNLIDALKETASFKRYEEAIEFKIETLKIYQERSNIRNGRLMNILLYILTAFGSFQTLQILNDSFNIPIKISACIVLPIFFVAGLYWFIKENK